MRSKRDTNLDRRRLSNNFAKVLLPTLFGPSTMQTIRSESDEDDATGSLMGSRGAKSDKALVQEPGERTDVSDGAGSST